jgi:dihydroflavonol-4-reductase
MSIVLVTGGSGFVGCHAILQLLAAGHEVRTTVRSLRREDDVRVMLRTGGAEPGSRLSFFAADLQSAAGWADAVGGCDFVLHVASPFPAGIPKNDDELIIPARAGAIRVLTAARDAHVKRVVLTSSFAAIGYGHPPQEAPFDETSWTNIAGDGVPAYIKSKAMAERAAWDFVLREGGKLELTVVNPVGIFGPVLGPDYSSSISIIKSLLDGMPGCPKITFGLVDVRDVVDLHIRAMTDPAAKGERFIAVAGGSMSMLQVAKVLRRRMGASGRKTPKFQLPNWLVRIAAKRNPALGQVVPQLGKRRDSSNEKAKRVLGWAPRSNEEVIVATGESLVNFGLLNAIPG